MRRITAIGAALLLCFVTGCGSPTPAGLKGKVTLDDVPVENGNITFYSTDAGGTRAAVPITNGEYAAPALAPGTYKVEVSWMKPTGKKVASADPGMTMDETREAVPRKYNADTVLTAEVGAKETVKDFALTSK